MAVGLAALSPTGAQADPDEPGSPGSTSGPLSGGEKRSVITLITGDKALVTISADGAPSAVLQTDEPYLSRREGDQLYVVPKSAQAAVDSGALDQELFNVAALVRAGWDDAGRDDIPLIVEGRVPTGKGVGSRLRLDSIDATATSIAKDNATSIWKQSLSANARSTAGRIWLDAPIEGFGLDPATGVGQTGAPQLWKKGYTGKGTKVAVLDSGADITHPDLKDRIVATQNFTTDPTSTDVTDYDGHGTHVASTVAGTGAASKGKRRGMAPEADLLIGKVLDWSGGQESWIINAMEWTVDQKADVVNMSLGSQAPTNCKDPIATAANTLSKQSKTLFVVAAGNLGANETISSPACAAGVLTVGAVDARGKVASFSSRGPTMAGHAMKPNLTAPGVDITGAAAFSFGDIHYTSMSGTSMSSPHVAGAAALLRDAHPGWSADRLRQALTSGAKTGPKGNVYESGTGELSVPRALNSKLLATEGVTVARFSYPHTGKEQQTRRVRFTNTAKKPIEVRFRLRGVRSALGAKVPTRAMRLDRTKATIKRGRSVNVPVTVRDVVKGMPLDGYGGIGGRIVAVRAKGKHKGQVLATGSAGYWLEPKSADLELSFLDRDGQAPDWGQVTMFQLDDATGQAGTVGSEPVSARMRTGKVSIDAFVHTQSTGEWTYISFPEFELRKDTKLTLDARDAIPIEVDTEQASAARAGSMNYTRISDDDWVLSQNIYARSLDDGEGEVKMSVLPTTGKVTNGTASFTSYWRMFDDAVPAVDSDFVYNLAFSEKGGVKADQSHQVADEDLASVEEKWNALDTADHTYYDMAGVLDPVTGESRIIGDINEVGAPGVRTAYYPAGQPVQQIVMSRLMFTETFYSPYRTYQPGEESSVEWYKMPSSSALPQQADGSPGRAGERQANLMGVGFAQWKDASGNLGAGGFGDIGNAELFADGQSLGDTGFPAGQWIVPAEKTDYELLLNQLTFRPPPFWHLGLFTTTRFGFSSQASSDPEEVTVLPITMPFFDADVNDHNKAPATDAFPLDIEFQGQDGYDPGTMSDVEVEVSYEQFDLNSEKLPIDYEWSEPVPVEQVDGHWVATIDNTPVPGQYVSVHVSGTTEDGATVDQYAMHVYGVE